MSGELIEPVDFLDSEQAEVFVQEHFASFPSRLRHILVVSELTRQTTRDINELNPSIVLDENLAYCSALLHDVGYLEPLAVTGFHPLDGYNYLSRVGYLTIAKIVIEHSSSREEANLLGLVLPAGTDNLIAKVLSSWDMRVKQGGAIVTYDERLHDIAERYGEDSLVYRANIAAKPRITEVIEEIERLSGGRPA